MSKLSKVSFLFSGISFICLILARMAYGGWHHLFWVPLVFFLVLFVLPFAKDGKFFTEFFRMKTTKKGFSMGTMILMVLAALVMINVIGVRKYKTWDFSASQSATLADQSVQLLKSLDSELKATFFYKDGVEGNEENRRAFRELIKKYQDHSDRIALNFVEVNERPDLATEYGVTKGSGVVFVEYKGRRNRIEKIEEQEVTGALVKLLREKDKQIYFVIGHGELDLEDGKEALGLNALKLLFTNNRYAVQTLALNTSPKIPDDADAVAIVGPQQNFLDHEIKALEEYLKSGGRLVMALESKKTGGLEKILNRVGIAPENNYVLNIVETEMGRGVNQGPTMAPIFSQENEITKVFGQNQVVVFRLPMGLKLEKQIPGITIDEIVKAPENSMAFQDMTIKGEGPTGAFTMGMSVEGRWPGAADDAKEFHMVVFGDAEFLANAMLYQNLNRDLALNTIASLVNEQNMISITPKEAAITKMILTDSNFAMFVWSFIVPLPLLLLSASIGLWMRRRFA
jgi:ABC-type uncharacterized transport system involved in gliding motility auxiliary subunit